MRLSSLPLTAYALLTLLGSGRAFGQESVQFIGIESNAAADKQLVTILSQKTQGLAFQTHTMAYDSAVMRTADWDRNREGRYLAHLTPYACVAAEMLGARFEVLATYHSKATDDTVYHSYFVVNRADFDAVIRRSDEVADPDVAQLRNYLKGRDKPATFTYHDKFSTSSFFLPSLFFRDQRIFAISEAAGRSLIPILVNKAPAGFGSSDLIRMVADGKDAQLAAVWDKTVKTAKDDDPKTAAKVYFIELPTAIPNDLLVLSAPLGNGTATGQQDLTKKSILDAIHYTKATPNWRPADKKADKKTTEATEEFQWWVDLQQPIESESTDALAALGELRRLAATRPPDVPVQIEWDPRQTAPNQTGQNDLLMAVQNGVRLAGTEFVLYEKEFHKNADVKWTLMSIHDGALQLTSQIQGVQIENQVFPISFENAGDLTTRIAALVQLRLHRIRYVWPYQDNYPAVIRDIEFDPESRVVVQRISWTDPDRNEYEEGTPFAASITKVDDLYKLQLSEGLFPRGQDSAFQFEPMSNVAYRVILKRPSAETTKFMALTGAGLAALTLAAVGFFWDLRRKRPAPVGFPQTYRRIVDEYHEVWRGRQINDSDVLWCNPKLDEFINLCKDKPNPLAEEAEKVKVPLLQITVGSLKDIVMWVFGSKLKLVPALAEVSEVGSAAALDSLIQFLVHTRRLSPFTGRPMEWDALEDMMHRNFRRLGVPDTAASAARLHRDASLTGMVSRHFQEVIAKKAKTASLFRQSWKIQDDPNGFRLTHEEDLGGDLRIVFKEGTVTARALLMEFVVPPDQSLKEALINANGEAWVLGNIQDTTYVDYNGSYALTVKLQPIAVLKPAEEGEILVTHKALAATKGVN